MMGPIRLTPHRSGLSPPPRGPGQLLLQLRRAQSRWASFCTSASSREWSRSEGPPRQGSAGLGGLVLVPGVGRAQRALRREGSASMVSTCSRSLGTSVPTGCERWWPGRAYSLPYLLWTHRDTDWTLTRCFIVAGGPRQGGLPLGPGVRLRGAGMSRQRAWRGRGTPTRAPSPALCGSDHLLASGPAPLTGRMCSLWASEPQARLGVHAPAPSFHLHAFPGGDRRGVPCWCGR